MTLRNQIAHRLCAFLDDDWSLGKKLYLSEADAIMALVLAHATSDEAVGRAKPKPRRKRVSASPAGPSGSVGV